MIDVDLIQQCADPRLDVAIVQQFVAEMGAPDHPEKGGGKLEHGSGGMVRLRAA